MSDRPSPSEDLRVWMRQERKALGVSQTELGAALGLHYVTVLNIEQGHRRIMWDEGWAIIDALEGFRAARHTGPPPIPRALPVPAAADERAEDAA